MEPAGPKPGFLDVDRLLESSQPHPRVNLVWWVGGLFLVVMLGTLLAGGTSPQARQAVSILSAVGMMGIVTAIFFSSLYTARQFRAEHQRVEGIGEMVQLRRWTEASMALELYLSQPARTQAFRVQALMYLAPVLGKLNRYDDAIAVQSYLIEEGLVDGGGAAAVRVGRAMAMLHEDHLFDADRAINELRRGPAADTGALALLEIYRDVKTGHPAEAIEIFERKLPTLRDQLGHRVADAYALIARAYDLSGRESDARTAFHRATLLAPLGELAGRYVEIGKLAGRYAPAPAPPEAA